MLIWNSVKGIGWLCYLAGALLILQSSIAEYLPGGTGVFIAQKGELGKNLFWLANLRLHVAAGLLCLFSCLLQFSKSLLQRAPKLHRLMGRIYAFAILFVVSPTGIVLALFAKGGVAGRAGFLLLGVLTFQSTLLGITSMLGTRPDLLRHRQWMTRSFAFAASAITFRVYHFGFFQCGIAEETSYVVSLYLSILGNAAVTEGVLRWRPRFSSVPIPTLS